MKTYITFGLSHKHEIDGIIFDKNCVLMIESNCTEANRQKAFNLFGDKFSTECPEEFFNYESMKYYSRGIINLRGGSVEIPN